MKATDLLIGAAIVAVGYLAWSATRPPPAMPAPSSSSSSLTGILATLGESAASQIGSSLSQRLGEAIRGEREWW